jgi:hypothetical protein
MSCWCIVECQVDSVDVADLYIEPGTPFAPRSGPSLALGPTARRDEDESDRTSVFT